MRDLARRLVSCSAASDVSADPEREAKVQPGDERQNHAYLAADAREVWVVGDDGVPEIHTSDGRVAVSGLGFELPRL